MLDYTIGTAFLFGAGLGKIIFISFKVICFFLASQKAWPARNYNSSQKTIFLYLQTIFQNVQIVCII